jgi:formylglycine-generating enzyme required for sulfatase activity
MTATRHFVNSLGMKMIFVQALPFDAWTPSFADHKKAVEEVSGTLERPPVPHRVELPCDFCLAEFPVTNAIYRRFVRETGHREPGGELIDMDGVKTGKGSSVTSAPSEGVEAWKLEPFAADDQPVVGVNVMDAEVFCQWLCAKEGRTFRLPEVYEWEYACRAGTDSLFWWGDRADVRYLNYAASRVGHPTPVGLYPPNPWGFHDMHGNVAECCAQIGRPGGVQKGGAWNYPGGLLGADVYVDVRGTFTPHMPVVRRTLEIGFRIACDVGEAAPRPTDLPAPTVVAAAGAGPVIPRLKITVGDRIDLGPVRVQQAVDFLVTRNGAWIYNHKRSTDQGKTWRECPSLGSAHCRLRDGTILAVHTLDSVVGTRPFLWPDPLVGKTTFTVMVSTDDWQTVEPVEASLFVPLGKQFQPVRGLMELEDGALLMALYGWNHGDEVREDNTMFPIADQCYKTRVILVRSTDRGRSWSYFSTIFNHQAMGREGANENTLVQLSTGDLFAALRTGLHGFTDPLGRAELDEPLLATWSRSGGESWSEPERIYLDGRLVTGINPAAVVTDDGVLAVLRCRPDGSVILSPDGSGTVWTDEVVYFPFEQAPRFPGGMNDLELIAPDTLLVATYTVDEPGGEKQGVGIPITVRKG